MVTGDQSYGKPVNGNRFGREMQLISSDVCDLTKQKEELVMRLTNQLVALDNDRTAITEQSTANAVLGTDVSNVVAQKVRPSDASKFRSHVDDVGHITKLLLSLSGRLARVENSLPITVDAAEKVNFYTNVILPPPLKKNTFSRISKKNAIKQLI